jgi:hypothetical protein
MKGSNNSKRQQLVLKLALLGILAANVSWDKTFQTIHSMHSTDLASAKMEMTANKTGDTATGAALSKSPNGLAPNKDGAKGPAPLVTLAGGKKDIRTVRSFEMTMCNKSVDYTFSITKDGDVSSLNLSLSMNGNQIGKTLTTSGVSNLDELNNDASRKANEKKLATLLLSNKTIDCGTAEQVYSVKETTPDPTLKAASKEMNSNSISDLISSAVVDNSNKGSTEVARTGSVQTPPNPPAPPAPPTAEEKAKIAKQIAECKIGKADKDGKNPTLSVEDKLTCNHARLDTMISDIDDSTPTLARQSLAKIKAVIAEIMAPVRKQLQSKEEVDRDAAKVHLESIVSALEEIRDGNDGMPKDQLNKMIAEYKALGDASDVFQKANELMAREKTVRDDYILAALDLRQNPTSEYAAGEMQAAMREFQDLGLEKQNSLDFTVGYDRYGRKVMLPGPYAKLQAENNLGLFEGTDFQDFTKPVRTLNSSLAEFQKVKITRGANGKYVVDDSSLTLLGGADDIPVPSDLSRFRTALYSQGRNGLRVYGAAEPVRPHLSLADFGNYGTSVITPSSTFNSLTGDPQVSQRRPLLGGRALLIED